LLHAEFIEFGRSGKVYSRSDVIEALLTETEPAIVSADQFALRRLTRDIALLTYRTANVRPDGSLDRHTLRSSIWQHSPLGWQASFHQGTPTVPF